MDAPTIVVRPGEGRSVWLGGMGGVQGLRGGHRTGVRGPHGPRRAAWLPSLPDLCGI